MRCKKHFADLSSTVGVCASCLSERLFALIAAQTKAQSQSQSHLNSIDDHSRNNKPDPAISNNPPPLVFPRSVSPYISRRKSDNGVWPPSHHHHHNHSLPDHRFYSTPQIGPSCPTVDSSGSYKKKHYRFSLLSNLFRSRSHQRDSDHPNSNSDPRVSVSNSRESTGVVAPSASSSSWFSGILPGRRRKQSRLFSLDEPQTVSGGLRIQAGCRDRGMSPERFPEEEECFDSGYSSESSQGWKQTPRRKNQTARRSNPGRNVTGLAFCLSPLVRASPNRHWNQKGMPPETAFSGEIRVSVKPHISNAAAFCANRSRKLADFGRSNPNH